MAKHNGITIRIGASHDEVEAMGITYDRAEMRKAGAHKTQGTLRRGVVDAWSEVRDRRAKDKDRTNKRRAARRSKRQDHELQDA